MHGVSAVRRFTVPGKAVPQGSLRPFKNRATGQVMVTQKSNVLVYRADVQKSWGEPDPLTGPMRVVLEFRFKRPQSHFNKSGLKKGAPQHHTQMPDVDKLARSVLDALTGYAWHDDKQVIELRATKVWWHNSETVVAVEEL